MEFNIANRMRTITPSPIREMFKLTSEPGVISFGAGSPSPEAYPAKEMEEIIIKAFENPAAFLNYGITEGYSPLRETTKRRLQECYATGTEQDDVIITSGGQQSMDLAAKCLVNEGDTVLCETPSFSGSMNTFLSYNANLVPCRMDEEGMDLNDLESKLKTEKNVKAIYTIPTFQNPSGRTLSAPRRKAMLELAQKYDVVIIEDDPYSELRYSGDPVPTIKSMDQDGRVIYCGSYSKVFAPGIRVGFCLADKAIAKKMTIAKQASDVHANVLFQIVVDEYIRNYPFEAHLERIRSLYRVKRDAMLNALSAIDPRVSYTRPEGGLFLLCSLPEKYDSMQLSDLIWKKKKVIIVPGCGFVLDKFSPNPAFRLNFSMPSIEQIETGIAAIVECVDEMLAKD